MPVVSALIIEFESEADAIAVVEMLKEDRKRVHAAYMRLSDGRTVEFDHHADELKAKQAGSP
jgi:hypothetical protein